MQYFKQFFRSSKTKLSSELEQNGGVVSPQCQTATLATPNESRRIIKTVDGLELVLCSDDVKYIEVIQSMFDNLKKLNGDHDLGNVPAIIIPISIDSITMQRIIDWSRATKTNKTTHFDTFFSSITIEEACRLIEASLFLETKSLGETAAKWVASKLEGKTTQQMAELLGRKTVGLDEEEQKKLDFYRIVTIKEKPQIVDNGY